jgi:N-acetylglucosaminyldiphosphoundecaprenol N-acetyl-beta-D-mannosaminyltransferase
MRKTVDILGIPVDEVKMNEAVEKVKEFLSEEKVHMIYTPNAEIIYAAQKDSELNRVLKAADLLVADGAGVVLASKILGVGLPEKVSGIDLVKLSFTLKMSKPIKYFFFGAKPGVADTAKDSLLRQYPNIEIVGCRNGYFSKEEEPEIIEQINSSGADILLVALGAPRQEKWIYEHKATLKTKVCIGVGGILDVYAGVVQPAPEIFRRNGFEWLFRLYKEPWRFKRMLNLPKFVLLTVAVRFKLRNR